MNFKVIGQFILVYILLVGLLMISITPLFLIVMIDLVFPKISELSIISKPFVTPDLLNFIVMDYLVSNIIFILLGIEFDKFLKLN